MFVLVKLIAHHCHRTDLTDYLTQGIITTTVGLFVGLAADQRGSCNPSVSKMLCLHLPSLLPPSFLPMDLASPVQAAAIAAIGLLYLGSSHRLMTEFLLNEIGRPPVKDQNATDREGLALVRQMKFCSIRADESLIVDANLCHLSFCRCVDYPLEWLT